MSDTAQSPAHADSKGFPWLLVAVVGLGLTVFLGMKDKQELFQSYLFGYAFWFGISLGCLSLFLLHNLTGGQWGFVIRRILEAGTRNIPLFALLAIPFLLWGMEYVYPWLNPDVLSHDHIVQAKTRYLNKDFYIIRFVVFMLFWSGLAHLLYRISGKQDTDSSESLVKKLRATSAPGMIFFFLTMTLFGTDLLMSLEPQWFSTVYPIQLLIGQGLGALALCTIIAIKVSERDPALGNYLTPARLHDLGNLMLALTLFWTYITFTQFLIVWSANLAEEVPWYLNRARGGWQFFAIALAVFAFFLPFFILLMRPIKKKKALLIKVAGLIFFMRLIDLSWIVLPSFSPSRFSVSLLNIAAWVGFGGLWMAVMKAGLAKRPILPMQDARLKYILATEEKHHE